jgi:hypothetical protein
MTRMPSLSATVLAAFVALGVGAAWAQDQSQPQEGCTIVDGVATGAGCDAASQGAGAVENGMPATEHQQEVLKTDDDAAKGQNMEATGAGGAEMPATEHQQEVLQGQDGQSGSTNQ